MWVEDKQQANNKMFFFLKPVSEMVDSVRHNDQCDLKFGIVKIRQQRQTHKNIHIKKAE